jgi:hypothetical protein
MVAEIPEGIGPPRPGSGMGGLAEALFVIAIEPAMRDSAVGNVVKALKHRNSPFEVACIQGCAWVVVASKRQVQTAK